MAALGLRLCSRPSPCLETTVFSLGSPRVRLAPLPPAPALQESPWAPPFAPGPSVSLLTCCWGQFLGSRTLAPLPVQLPADPQAHCVCVSLPSPWDFQPPLPFSVLAQPRCPEAARSRSQSVPSSCPKAEFQPRLTQLSTGSPRCGCLPRSLETWAAQLSSSVHLVAGTAEPCGLVSRLWSRLFTSCLRTHSS